MTDTDTTSLLASALENEGALLLKLISELNNEDLFDFARQIAELNPTVGRTPADEILNVAHNIKNIETALENFYAV
jgi:hypothetical protein